MTEPTNAQRVQRAQAALKAYADFHNEGIDEATISDLLADLHHSIAVDTSVTDAIDKMEDNLRHAVANFVAEAGPDHDTPPDPNPIPKELQHMSSDVLAHLRSAIDTIIDTGRAEEQRQEEERKYVEDDIAFRSRATKMAETVVADINNLAVILWNTRFPRAVLGAAGPFNVYSLSHDDSQLIRTGFEHDKHGKGVFKRVLNLKVTRSAYPLSWPENDPRGAAFIKVFSDLGHDSRFAPVISVYEGPSVEYPWRFLNTWYARGAAGTGGGARSYQEFIDLITAALTKVVVAP